MRTTYDAIIIGGGVIGCSIAYELSKQNKRVLLLEKETIGSRASSAAAGMLGAEMEFETNHPLYLLAKESRDSFSSLSQELFDVCGIDIELIQEGIYELAFTEEEAVDLKREAAKRQDQGEEVFWLPAQDLLRKEPALSPLVKGALYFEKDAQVSPVKLTRAFYQSAKILGAEIKEHRKVVQLLQTGNKVTGVVTTKETFHADSVIVAGGVWSSDLEPSLKMMPVKGECLSFKTKQPLLTGTVKYKNCYLVPKRENRILVGATSTPHVFDEEVTFSGLFELMEKAKQIVPEVSSASFEKAWGGIRPQTLSGKPYIGPHPHKEGLILSTGHYRNGILLSAITGKRIADHIESEVHHS
ncbi:glycine oxidase ThiO [Fictibacillus norfolkensis]|uniref:glycine oxidase n=1 Tax=Fictibacillus norfolkensis TaxID=2762233 RepID=A0ABR8SNF2_9BACL|nr:glycine oxidase ThiO [Fictibacillus norfolkensis]MBD7965017.1 glycine oxidase ThiO [Fictibacillus norfolkensis]